MNKLAIVLAVLTTFLMAGCAAQKTTSAAPAAKIMMDDSVLPEIVAYDDEAYDALPDMVAAE
jgi:uncharacterized protein YcfL